MGDLIILLFIGTLFLGGYWIFVLMPRQRDFIKRQQMARTLVEGDEVVTGGGIVGRIKRIDASQGVAYLEIAPGLEVRIVTAAILDRFDPDNIARDANIDQSQASGSS